MTTNILQAVRWNTAQKVLFRFIFLYTLFYTLPFPVNYIPYGQYLSHWIGQFWQWLSLWTADHIFHIAEELPLSGRGSGDITLAYLRVFVQLVIAAAGTIIWSVSDRKREHYSKLFRYHIVFLRYYTAFLLLTYGIIKIIPTQFSNLSLFDLIKTYGDSSPMGLMWNFMEYSDTYTRFSGIAEALGGILLLFRRTERLGALVGFGVMLNVFLMNMSYDVPVKLLSFHLMFICAIILSAHIKAFLNFFLFNKTAPPVQIFSYSSHKKARIAGYVFKGILILYFVIPRVINTNEYYTKRRDKASLPALYGIYDVKDFIYNGDTIAPLLTDTLRWKRMVIDRNSTGIVKMNDKIIPIQNNTDTLKHTLTLTSWQDTTSTHSFTYKVRDSMLYVNGTYGKDRMDITLKKKDLNDFLLINRGFHWINEYPFNR
ncbi:hypothetical protein [Sinomicrobium sp. M5D2P17]